MKNRKSLLWGLAGLAVIILLGGYLYNEDQKRRTAQTEAIEREEADASQKAAEAESAAAVSEETATEEPAKEAVETTEAQEQTAPKADTAAEEVVAEKPAAEETVAAEPVPAPQFDLVRVEPDGSTIIAGKAKAGTVVEVVTGDTVLAQTEVGQSGDFAAVFEDPLDPGDYEIVLRIVEDGEVVAQSQEVATVSVPEERPEDLLVIVTKPGEASRILTQPSAVETASAAAEQSVTSSADDKAAEETGTDVAGAADDQTPAASSEAAAAKPETPAAEEDAVQVSDAGDSASPAPGEEKIAEAEPADTAAADEKQVAAVEAAKPAATSETEAPAATAKVSAPDSKDTTIPTANLRIDAVEIEKGRVFVAGSATPGASVRVYADGIAIGDSRVSANGRFLVEAERDIAVGRHTISADLMMPGSDATTMRVAVPFERPQGDSVAAVAAPEASGTTAQTAKVADAVGSDDDASQPLQTPVAADAGESTVPADGTQQASQSGQDATPTAGETAMETAARDAPADPASSGSESEQDNVAGSSSDQQKTTGEATEVETAVAGTAASETGRVTTEGSPAAGQSEAADSAPSRDTEIAAADTTPPPPPTVVQEPLEPKQGSVIIRRGDTLWQISRRVYGRGVRYTTIYLANSDQITNPDFIEPGQIFMVPQEPLDNAEQLHRDRIRRR